MKLKGLVTVQDIKQQTIDRNREAMHLFEKCINTVVCCDKPLKTCDSENKEKT